LKTQENNLNEITNEKEEFKQKLQKLSEDFNKAKIGQL